MLKYTNAPIGVVIASAAYNSGNVVGSTTAQSLATGAVLFMPVGNTTSHALTANISTDGFFQWKDKNGKILNTDVINYSGIITSGGLLSTYTAYAAPAAQVSYVGYNGSTGSINVLDSEPYEMVLYMKNSSIMGGHLTNAYTKHIGGFTTSSNATQEEIALATAYSVYKNFKEERVMKIQADAMCNATLTLTNGTKANQEVTVVRGSNILTFETDVTYAGGGSTLVVGDYLRLGSPGVNVVISDPVYKVTAINGVYVTVDRPVTKASGTYQDASGGTVDIEVIPSATGLAANWGVRFVGIELFATTYGIETTNYWSIDGRMQYDVTSFTIAFKSGFNVNDTLLTYATAASYGNGTYWEVAEQEYFTQGFDGKGIYTGYPAFIPRTNATNYNTGGATDYGYAKYTISWYDDGTTSVGTGLTQKQPKTIEVYVPSADTTSLDRMDDGFRTAD